MMITLIVSCVFYYLSHNFFFLPIECENLIVIYSFLHLAAVLLMTWLRTVIIEFMTTSYYFKFVIWNL